MRTPIQNAPNLARLLALMLIAILNPSLSGFAQGSAFTYQGSLRDGGAPANAVYDLRFTIYAAASDGSVAGGPVDVGEVSVTNGLFTVTLDFGVNVFTGADRWLEIEVRTNGAAAFTALLPRQPVQPAPYAIHAANAGEAAAVPAGTITSAMLANGAVTSLKIAPGASSALDAPDGSPLRALFVNTNGAVGIGTNTSGAALQVAGGTNYFSPANPRLLNVITNHSTVVGVSNMIAPVNVFLSGTRAYVTAFASSALLIFDVADPLQPRLLGEAVDDSTRPGSPFTRLSGASGIFVTNNIAYVTAENEKTLTIINVANPQNLVKLAEVTDGVGGFNGLDLPTDVLVSGTNCFILGFYDSALSILDVSDPSSPRLLKEIFDDSVVPGSPFTKLKWPYQMTLVGTRLYIASRGDSAVTILDVSSPSNPQLLGEIVDSTVNPVSPFTRLANANWVEVVGNVAYVAAGAFNTSLGSLTLVDVSNPAAPIKLAELSDDTVQPGSPFTKLRGAWGVKVKNNTAFVTCYGDNALTVIDVADPRHPRLLKELVDGRDGFNHMLWTEGIAIAGDKLYLVGGSDNALNIIDFPAQLGLVVDQFVGIGTSSPRSTLDVAGVITARGLNVEGAVIAAGNGEFANLAARGSVVVDSANTNNGFRLPGVAFGTGSGEGIASRRTTGPGQYGLDFYTGSQRRMQIANSGNVGVGLTGTNAPRHRLSIGGGPLWTANLWTGAIELEHASAIAWPANAAGQRFGMGHTEGGFYFFRTASDPGATTSGAVYDLSISDSGTVRIFGANALELGAGVAGKEASAGRIGYQTFTSGALDIVGAGTAGLNNRRIKFWCEAGATFTGVITAPSDRNLKQDFQPLDGRAVLEKVVALPIQSWGYKSDPDKRHIGPVAQDFHAAFGLNGADDTAIATVDADGVALAAIQGLNQMLEAQRAENVALKQRLEKLEQLLNQNNGDQ